MSKEKVTRKWDSFLPTTIMERERKGKKVSYYSHVPHQLPDLSIYIWRGQQNYSKCKNRVRKRLHSLQHSHWRRLVKGLLIADNRNPSKLVQAKQGILFKSFQGNHWELNSGKYNWVLSRNNDCIPEICQASLYLLKATSAEIDQQRPCSHELAFQVGRQTMNTQPHK